MTCYLDKHTHNQNRRLDRQLMTLQEDLVSLSGIVTHLAGLSNEDLATFEIGDQLDAIHHCLNRFEARCMASRLAAYENEFAEPFIDESAVEKTDIPKYDWSIVRKDAKRANKLTNQLTLTLSRVRSGMSGLQVQSHVPEDIEQFSQVVGNAVSGLASEWNSNPG